MQIVFLSKVSFKGDPQWNLMEVAPVKKVTFIVFVISESTLFAFCILRTFLKQVIKDKTRDKVLLFPVWRQNPLGLVISSQAMDPALDKDEPEFRILIL